MARAELRETYGRRWRKHTPQRTRVLLKLGELAPATVPADPEPEPDRPAEDAPQAKPRPARRSKAKAKAGRTPAELLAAAREATATWSDAELTADRIRTTVRVSAANARMLRDALKTERTGGGDRADLEPVAA
ncbi:hypothetical protein [Streptomyces sp. NBC_00885]|uniref:hypothetical protein n=1 Tax=Streptomyces sp. NBC_00885 TaxID=2975857 RepID=UPI00386309B5